MLVLSCTLQTFSLDHIALQLGKWCWVWAACGSDWEAASARAPPSGAVSPAVPSVTCLALLPRALSTRPAALAAAPFPNRLSLSLILNPTVGAMS